MSKTAMEQIREFVGENFLLGRENQLGDGDSFLEEGIIDSTGVLELVSFLEQRFGIRVANEEMTTANLDSVFLVDAYIARKLAAKADEVKDKDKA
jgi:acyl carrier protein